MDPSDTDLLDTRGRLRRLALAAAVALAITVAVMRWIIAVSKEPNADPMGGSIVGLVAICVFTMACAVVHRGLAALHARRRR